MTSPVFALYLTCLFLAKTVQTTALNSSSSVCQDSGFTSVNVGDSVSLRCSYEGDVAAKFYWYKQTLGQKPRLISTFDTFDKTITFSDEFSNNHRFTLDTKNDKNDLKITDLHISDSATYYCLSSYLNKLEFVEGTTLNVKSSGLNIQALVHQSASESIQPGGSVTLNCTVHFGTCNDGERSVYWFKDSQESQPGIVGLLIYTYRGNNDQCERNTDTQTHTCVYNLPMKSLNLSHAGTYYCAVASCGRILFGDGTKLDVEHEADSLVLYFLSGALAFTTILSVLLAFSVYKMNKRNGSQSESQHGLSAPSTADAEQGYQDTDNLHYAALNANVANRPRRARNNTKNECVYSSVKI